MLMPPGQHRLHDAEDGRVGGDAETQGQEYRGREAAVPAKRAEYVLQVLDQGVHVAPPNRCVRRGRLQDGHRARPLRLEV